MYKNNKNKMSRRKALNLMKTNAGGVNVISDKNNTVGGDYNTIAHIHPKGYFISIIDIDRPYTADEFRQITKGIDTSFEFDNMYLKSLGGITDVYVDGNQVLGVLIKPYSENEIVIANISRGKILFNTKEKIDGYTVGMIYNHMNINEAYVSNFEYLKYIN